MTKKDNTAALHWFPGYDRIQCKLVQFEFKAFKCFSRACGR